ncbi:hypothetical protein HZA38_04580 [Candidatus Peregrinibacteria bacterium]|nr:hypothetical protein [Candidatus Peregrinibacteria bacterium]
MPRGEKKRIIVQLFAEGGTLLGQKYIYNKNENLALFKEKVAARKVLRYSPKDRKRIPVVKVKEEKHSSS